MTDAKRAKAFSHPLRIAILKSLQGRVATTAQLASELDSSVSGIGYHVRRLESLGLVVRVERRIKAGTVEHSYTAASGSTDASARDPASS